MSEPRQEFLRWGMLVDWLADDFGFSMYQIRKWVEEKVIVGEPLVPGRQPKADGGRRKSEVGKRQGTNGAKHKGRQQGQLVNYYRKSQVKEALGL